MAWHDKQSMEASSPRGLLRLSRGRVCCMLMRLALAENSFISAFRDRPMAFLATADPDKDGLSSGSRNV